MFNESRIGLRFKLWLFWIQVKRIFYVYGNKILIGGVLLTVFVLVLVFYSIRLSTLGLPLGAESRISEVRDAVETLKRRNQELEQMLVIIKEKVEHTDSSLVSIEKRLGIRKIEPETVRPVEETELTRSLERKIKELEISLASVRERNKQLETLRAKAEKELLSARKETEEVRKQSSSLVATRDELDGTIRSLEKRIKDLEKSLSETKLKAEEQETLKLKTEKELESYLAAGGKTDELVKNLQMKVSELENSLKETKIKAEQIEIAKKEVEKELETARKENAELKRQSETLSATKGTNEEMIRNLEKKVKELEETLAQTKRKAEEAEIRPLVPTTTKEITVEEKPEIKTYEVKQGDTLRAIAEKLYGDGARWKEIYDANKDKIKEKGLTPGLILTIP